MEDGLVAEVLTDNPEGRFHPDLHFVPCGDEVTEGFLWVDGTFVLPAKKQGFAAATAVEKKEAYRLKCAQEVGQAYAMADEIKLLRRSLRRLAEEGRLDDEFLDYHQQVEQRVAAVKGRMYPEETAQA